VSAALQRVGRSGHSVGAVSGGVVFPRYPSDLLACATIVKAMHEGAIEATGIPKNPVDVLCAQRVEGTGRLFKGRPRSTPGKLFS
jgi:ATP-dependent Lhr-like helicase